MASDQRIDEVIGRFVRSLEVARVPYMVTGSFASSYHGAPRTTQDIDIVIAPTLVTLRALLAQFPDEHYYVSEDAALDAYADEGMFNVIDHLTGWKVDFILRKRRPFSQHEFGRRRNVRSGRFKIQL